MANSKIRPTVRFIYASQFHISVVAITHRVRPSLVPTMTVGINIVAFQSVTPVKVTAPGRSRRVSISGNLRSEALGAHFRLVLYYRRASEEDTALAVASWVKETLSAELAEEPMLAGRLRREGEEVGGWWEVRFNDAGVRLVQASAAAAMAEFLDAGDREEREWGLVYWKDVERENPHQSALFYIQVTEFQGGDYSVGISCSLLLADPLLLIRFLLKWAETHRRMSDGCSLSAPTMFHLSQFRRSPLPARLAATPAAAYHTSTLLFRLPSAKHAPDTAALAALCPAEASAVAGAGFTFVLSDHAADVRVELLKNCGAAPERRGDGVEAARWEELGAGELALREGNLPVHVSYRIVPGGNETGVMVVAMVAADVSDVLVSATVPVSTKC